MNSLSWLIYFADVVEALDGPFVVLTLATPVVLFFVFFFFLAAEGDVPKSFTQWCLIITLVSFVMQAVIPSQKTILMIAASEIGEKVMTTPEVQRVRDIVLKKLDELES